MYKITSDYFFEQKKPLTHKIQLHTTWEVYKILQDIAIDNELSMSALINNAIIQYLINDIERVS